MSTSNLKDSSSSSLSRGFEAGVENGNYGTPVNAASAIAARRLSRKLSEQREFGICSTVDEFVLKHSGNRAIKTVCTLKPNFI